MADGELAQALAEFEAVHTRAMARVTTRRIELELTDREVDQLRDVMDALPAAMFGPLIVKVTAALPLTDVTSPLSLALSDVLRTRLPGSVA